MPFHQLGFTFSNTGEVVPYLLWQIIRGITGRRASHTSTQAHCEHPCPRLRVTALLLPATDLQEWVLDHCPEEVFTACCVLKLMLASNYGFWKNALAMGSDVLCRPKRSGARSLHALLLLMQATRSSCLVYPF